MSATAYAALPSVEYLPPLEAASPTSNSDLQSLGESTFVTEDGYRYKTVKRLCLRHRRDLNKLSLSEYLPPTQSAPLVADIPIIVDAAVDVEQNQESAVLTDDGYRYKTVKRFRNRHRRDTNQLPSNEYLSPLQEKTTSIVSVKQAVPIAATAKESAVLAKDGYRYKTVKRVVYRRRI